MNSFLLFLSLTIGAYQAQVIDVIDGDTIKVMVEIWPDVYQKASIRLDGINTPEKRGAPDCEKELAKKATQFTIDFINNGSVIVHDIKKGKFAGRMLGKVSVNGRDLGEALISNGHAVPYDGGKREAWEC